MELDKAIPYTGAQLGAGLQKAVQAAKAMPGEQVAIIHNVDAAAATVTLVDAATYRKTKSTLDPTDEVWNLGADDMFVDVDMPASRAVLANLSKAGNGDDDMAADLANAFVAMVNPTSDERDTGRGTKSWQSLPDDLRGRLVAIGVSQDNITRLSPAVYTRALTALCTGFTTESEAKAATRLLDALGDHDGLGKVMDELAKNGTDVAFTMVIDKAAPKMDHHKFGVGKDALVRQLLTAKTKPSASTLSRVLQAATIPTAVLRDWQANGMAGTKLDAEARTIVARQIISQTQE